VVLGALGVAGYDGVQALNGHRTMPGVAGDAAGAAAHAIAATHDNDKGRPAADGAARSHSAVVTHYHYDPVLARVDVTVSGSVRTLVLHYVDRGLVDDITASATARP